MIIFKDDIQKSRMSRAKIYARLNNFLKAREPKLARFLARYTSASDVITYQDLRQAILTGELESGALMRWQEDYSKMIIEHIYPEWERAMSYAAKTLEDKYPDFYFSPGDEGVQEWASTRAAEMY